jgi:hypothetical protein
MGGILNGDFDGFKTPLFKLFEKLSALVSEGRREEKSIDS